MNKESEQQSIHVGFVVDDKYVRYMAVTIASILHSADGRESFCFHVINDGSISDESRENIDGLKKIKDFSVIWYHVDKIMHHEKRKDTRKDIPMVTNYRLLQSSILSGLNKIIFLDADLIAISSLSDLWNINISDYYIATTPWIFQNKDYNKRIGISDDYSYCNTGVMLVNLEKWRKDNIEEKLLETEKKYRGIYLFYDQCIFNAALFDKILYIDEQWNFRPELWDNKRKIKRSYPNAFNYPKIIHWAYPVKPWQDKTLKYAKEYFFYAKFTPYYDSLISQLFPIRKVILYKLIAFAKRCFSFAKRRIKKAVKFVVND